MRKAELGHLILLVIIIGGFTLRYLNLTSLPYDYDEMWSVACCDPERAFTDMIAYMQRDPQPYLHYAVLWSAFKIFGFTEFVGRFISVICGTLLIYFTYLLGKVAINRDVGLYASAFVSVNYILITYSRICRSYPLFLLLAIVSTYLLVRVVQDKKSIVPYAISSILLVNTHYYGILVLAGHFFYLAYLFKSEKYLNKSFVFAWLATFVSFIPQIVRMFKILNTHDYNASLPTLSILFDFFVQYFSSPLIAVVFAILFFSFFAFDGRKSNETWLLLLVFVCNFVCPFALGYLLTDNILLRYTLVSLPLFLILSAGGLSLVTSNLVRRGFCCVLIFFSCYVLYERCVYAPTRKDFREAFLYVEEHNTGDPIFSPSNQIDMFIATARLLRKDPLPLRPLDEIRDLPTGARCWVLVGSVGFEAWLQHGIPDVKVRKVGGIIEPELLAIQYEKL